MITKEDLRMAFVRSDLQFLRMHADGLDEDPVLMAVGKAVTVAQLHRDIEAVVTCSSVEEAERVIELLARVAGPDDRVSTKECALEFPNGSAVRVVVEAMGKERRA